MTAFDVIRICLTTTFGTINLLAFSDRRFSLRTSLIIAAAFVIATTIVISLLTAFGNNVMIDNWIVFLVLQLAEIIALAFLFGKHNGFRSLFTAGIALVFNQIGAILTLSIAMFVKAPWLLYLLYALVYAALNVSVILFFRKVVIKLMALQSANWFAMFLLTVFILLVLALIVPLRATETVSINLTAGLLLSLSVVWVFVFMKRDLAASERRRVLFDGKNALETEVEKLESQILLMESNERNLAIFRHDMRHNLRIASELLAQRDLDGCKTLLLSLDESVQSLSHAAAKTRLCNNKFLNSVLTSFAETFEKEGIVFKTYIDLPDPDNEIYLSLAVVISNCLENALHAVVAARDQLSEPPEVSFKYYPAGKQMFLEIANPYAGEVKLEAATGYPITDRLGHGLGVKSVQSFAEQQSAIVLYTAESGVFKVRIIL